MSMLSRFATLGGAPPDPYFANVSYLLVGNGANGTTTNIKDSSNNNLATTIYGSAVISTAQSKYNSGSVSTPAIGSYMSVANTGVLNLSGTNWTIEGWVFPTASSSYRIIYDKRAGGSSTSYGGYLNNLNVCFQNGTLFESTTAIPLNQWSYLAWVYSGSTVKIYANGSLIYTTPNTSINEQNAPLYIAHAEPYASDSVGFLYDFRITKGVARYSGSTMTVPTGPLPTTGP